MGMLKHILNNQMVRQLLGAVAGMFIALAVYTAYRSASTAVRAYLIPPGADRTAFTGTVRVSDSTVYDDESRMARIAARARTTAAQLRANQQQINAAEVQQTSSEPAAEPEEPAVEQAPSEQPDERVMAAAQEAQENRNARLTQRQIMDATNHAAATVSEDSTHGAPALPSSGVGLWVAGAMALMLTLCGTRKGRMLLALEQKKVH